MLVMTMVHTVAEEEADHVASHDGLRRFSLDSIKEVKMTLEVMGSC